MPLLSTLHELITEYETAVKHVYEVRDKYGLKPGFDLERPSGGLFEKMKRHQKATRASTSMMLTCSSHTITLCCVVVGVFANDLYRAPPSEAEEQDKQRTIFTRSPILYSSQLAQPSLLSNEHCEVVILSNYRT